MPNTLIREGYLDSDKVSALSDFDDRVFFRLLLAADDAGRTDGRPDKLRSALFPTRETVRSADIVKALERLLAAGLITRWEWDSKPVIQIMRWQRRSGAQFSKFPDVEGAFKIVWVQVETRDGAQAFSSTSLQKGCARVHEPIGNPFVGVSEKPTETKTKSKTERTPHARGLDGMPIIPEPLRTPEFEAAWARWLEHRRQKRSKLTPLAAEEQLRKCEKWGVLGAIAAINQSIGHGWTGLFDPSNGRNEKPAPVPSVERSWGGE
jgi:hypothetical protein